jgi:hypothetical protein
MLTTTRLSARSPRVKALGPLSPELDRYYVAAPMTGKDQAAILVYAPEE